MSKLCRHSQAKPRKQRTTHPHPDPYPPDVSRPHASLLDLRYPDAPYEDLGDLVLEDTQRSQITSPRCPVKDTAVAIIRQRVIRPVLQQELESIMAIPLDGESDRGAAAA